MLSEMAEQKERTPCLIYTRVMGYLSPVPRYNIGKKSEFYSRKYFSKQKAFKSMENRLKANEDFNQKYS